MSKNGEGSLGWLRERNRERVLGTLRERGRISQADIARVTGLSRTTVHTLVAELKDSGLVHEVEAGEHETRGGRPAVQLMLRDSSLAEMTWGAGRECSNFAYIKAATGIGAGIVIDGRLLRGASGTAGEIGHTTLDESGALCYCGNRGCLETVASGPAIIGLVSSGHPETLTLGRVIELAANGDARCRRAISDAGREIGVAVAGLCNLINPERVVVGGLLSRAGNILLQPLRESIRRHAVQAAAERVDVRAASFVERAELLGALALALRGERAHEALS